VKDTITEEVVSTLASQPIGDAIPEPVLNWADKSLWIVMGFILLGHVARNLVSDEPFNIRKFIGEMILAAIGAVSIYVMGLLQGLPEPQIIFIGLLTSLGGLRALEWAAKITRAVKKIS